MFVDIIRPNDVSIDPERVIVKTAYLKVKIYTARQNQKAVTANLYSEWILSFGFARPYDR